MSGSVLIVASYALLAIFAAAFTFRSVKLARMPVHLRWELAPVPHEPACGVQTPTASNRRGHLPRIS